MNARAAGVLIATMAAWAAMAVAWGVQPERAPASPRDQPAPQRPAPPPAPAPEAPALPPGLAESPERRMLAQSVGVFEASLSVYLEPGAEPVKIKATAARELILGGRFLIERLQSTDAERPFAAMTVIGFNDAASSGPRLEIVRYNTMSPATMPEAGRWDEPTRTLTSTGEHEHAGMLARVRVVERHAEPGRFSTEFHVAFEGYSPEFLGVKLPEYKTLEIDYRRVEPR